MSFSDPCERCGAPLTDADRFCRFCGDGRPPGPPAGGGPEDAVSAALRAGNKIEAIRLFRELHKTGLRQAKEAVDALEKKLGL